MTSQAESFTYESEYENHLPVIWIVAVAIAFPLTLMASLLWTGLALAGMGLLCLGFGLVLVSLIAHCYYETPAWGTAIVGQFIGICGVVMLFMVSIL